MSHVSRRCSLSSVLCALSYVSVCSLSPVRCPQALYPGSVPLLPWSVPCVPSSFLRPLTLVNCPSVPFSVALVNSSCPLFLCFPPLFRRLLSSVPCLSFLWVSFESGLMYKARSSDRLASSQSLLAEVVSSSDVAIYELKKWLVGHCKKLRNVWILPKSLIMSYSTS